MAAAQGYRYLRVSVKVTGRRRIGIPALAHELQHAVEIAQAGDVRDERTLADLFRRIGWQSERRVSVFETEAARVVEERVRRELFPAKR